MKHLKPKLALLATVAYLSYYFLGAVYSIKQDHRYKKLVEQRVDLNQDGEISPDEAIKAYLDLGYSPRKLINAIDVDKYDSFIRSRLGEEKISLLRSVAIERYASSPPPEAQWYGIKCRQFDKIVDERLKKNNSLEEAKRIYRECYTNSVVPQLNIEYFGRSPWYIFITPFSMIRGSELERFALGEKK
jgi:hypothetical protein